MLLKYLKARSETAWADGQVSALVCIQWKLAHAQIARIQSVANHANDRVILGARGAENCSPGILLLPQLWRTLRTPWSHLAGQMKDSHPQEAASIFQQPLQNACIHAEYPPQYPSPPPGESALLANTSRLVANTHLAHLQPQLVMNESLGYAGVCWRCLMDSC